MAHLCHWRDARPILSFRLRTFLRIGAGRTVTIPGSIQLEERETVAKLLQQFWNDERGQDIAEYAVMLAVILVIVIGTVRLIGSNANNVFSQVGSAIQ